MSKTGQYKVNNSTVVDNTSYESNTSGQNYVLVDDTDFKQGTITLDAANTKIETGWVKLGLNVGSTSFYNVPTISGEKIVITNQSQNVTLGSITFNGDNVKFYDGEIYAKTGTISATLTLDENFVADASKAATAFTTQDAAKANPGKFGDFDITDETSTGSKPTEETGRVVFLNTHGYSGTFTITWDGIAGTGNNYKLYFKLS